MDVFKVRHYKLHLIWHNVAANKQRHEPDEWVGPRRRPEQQHVGLVSRAVRPPAAPQAPGPVCV